MIKKEKKLAQMEQDNFLNESFEEEIEENLQNELLEAKLAVQRVMSSQGLGTCGRSLWALGGLMALIGAHYATRPSPIALPNAG